MYCPWQLSSLTGAVLYSIQNWHSGICIVHDSFHSFFRCCHLKYSELASRYMYCPSMAAFILYRCCNLQYSELAFRFMYCPWQLSFLYRCSPLHYSELVFRYIYYPWQLSSFTGAVIYSIQNWHSGSCIVNGSFHSRYRYCHLQYSESVFRYMYCPWQLSSLYSFHSLTGTVIYSIQNWHSGICIIHDSFHPLQVLSSTVFRIDIQVHVLSMAASIPVTGTVIYSIQNQYSGICIVHDSFHPFTASIPLQVLSSTVFRIGIQVYVLSMTAFILYRCCPLQYSELTFRFMYCQWQLPFPLQVLSSTVFRISIQVYVLSMTAFIPLQLPFPYRYCHLQYSELAFRYMYYPWQLSSFTGAVLYSIQNWHSGICIVHGSFHPLQVLSCICLLVGLLFNALSFVATSWHN